MFLMIDNYDSFTYNLVQYFRTAGEEMEVIRNDAPLASVGIGRYAGIVLSPGPSTPENAGLTLDIIRNFSHVPILGVCLGMQSIAYCYGGRIVRARRIMHGKTDTVTHSGGDIFAGIPETFSAVRYHSLAAAEESLPDCLETTARSSDGEIMAIAHRELYIRGVQFHPESYMTEYGMTLIKNFIGGSYEFRKRTLEKGV